MSSNSFSSSPSVSTQGANGSGTGEVTTSITKTSSDPGASTLSPTTTSSSPIYSNPNSVPLSGSLYLFALLVAIVVLLCASVCIGSRLLYLRRRHRLLMAAIGDEQRVWIPTTSEYTYVNISPKQRPLMHEVYLGGGLFAADKTLHEKQLWNYITPLSVTNMKGSEIQLPTNAESPSLTPRSSSSVLGRVAATGRSLFHRRDQEAGSATSLRLSAMPSTSTPDYATQSSDSPNSAYARFASSSSSYPNSSLYVTVFIAMPSPIPLQSLKYHRTSITGKEDNLPRMEFGTVKVRGRMPLDGNDGDGGPAIQQ